MDRTTIELTALAFQAIVTSLVMLVYYGLWRQRRRPYYATWSVAWGLYALRLGFISAYIVERRDLWLFLHQVTTGFTALLLLYATLQFSGSARGWRRYLALAALVVGWSYLAVFQLQNMMVAGLTSSVLLSGVTLWTGIQFWRYRHQAPSIGATVLAWCFTLWGLHHLDYPLLRPLGAGVLFGVFADILFIMATAVGGVFLVLGHEQRTLESRTAQLEQLTRLLLRTQEDERRRISRELHDEAGQILTAVKIDLDLAGRAESSALVGRAIAQMRDLGNLLRPTVLDDLGLLPAIRSLAADFSTRTRIQTELVLAEDLPRLAPDHEVTIYRVVQEALTNVARHAGASRARVEIGRPESGLLRVRIEDDGRGATNGTPNLGLLGMHERVTALGGVLETGAAGESGFRVEATIPFAGRA